jgi:hypothetical protein
VIFRSRGGGNERTNRVSICAWHHLRGIHAGVVRAAGDANRRITWELGVGVRGIGTGTGQALLRLEDDVYADIQTTA